jgi:hypothetical protein
MGIFQCIVPESEMHVHIVSLNITLIPTKSFALMLFVVYEIATSSQWNVKEKRAVVLGGLARHISKFAFRSVARPTPTQQ